MESCRDEPDDINIAAVGIEHSLFGSEPEFYPALIDASVDLVRRIVHAFSTIMPWNFVGHGDLVKSRARARIFHGIAMRTSLSRGVCPLLHRLTHPEIQPFPMALGPDNSDPDESTIYSGFFDGNPGGVLRDGVRNRDAVRELQSDLRRIGYRFHEINGRFDGDTEISVRQFHNRFMNGARETPPDFSPSPPPREVNLASAIQIKRVLNKLDSLRASIP